MLRRDTLGWHLAVRDAVSLCGVLMRCAAPVARVRPGPHLVWLRGYGSVAARLESDTSPAGAVIAAMSHRAAATCPRPL